MTENIADIVVSFIRTQEEADYLIRQGKLASNANIAARCRRKAKILQVKADKLLAQYRSVNR